MYRITRFISIVIITLSISSGYSLSQEHRSGLMVMSIPYDSMMVTALTNAAKDVLWYQEVLPVRSPTFEIIQQSHWVIVGSEEGTVRVKFKSTDKDGNVKEDFKETTYVSFILFDLDGTIQAVDVKDRDSFSDIFKSIGSGENVYCTGAAKSFVKQIKQHLYCEYSIGEITGRDKKGRPQYILVNAGSSEGLSIT